MGQKSFLMISEENHANLTQYIDRLRSPGHLGKINKTAVARACGFSREVFQQNLRFSQTLDAAERELGIDVPQASEAETRSSDDKAKILRLEQQLTAVRSENYELRRRLRRYEAIVDHVACTGRRVVP